MAVRAIRGATCLTANNAEEMNEAVAELIDHIMMRNEITSAQVISIFLTGTPDLTCAFPAAGIRIHGLTDVPLMCAQEMDVVGALERVIRIMTHVETELDRSEVQHVYLRGAEVLRADLTEKSAEDADGA
ncbi:MAG: chorismate mutase [Candidatus Nanopelagicales bacterium]|nr:chorismate mutase [Candidatus Nanopelagicales bacterium]